jgi:hypothetical protein
LENLKERGNLEDLGLNGRIKSKVAPGYAMKAYRANSGRLHSFLTSN